MNVCSRLFVCVDLFIDEHIYRYVFGVCWLRLMFVCGFDSYCCYCVCFCSCGCVVLFG